MLEVYPEPDVNGMYHCTMDDPWNPTEEEIRAWAATADVYFPDHACQDWELSLIEDRNFDLIFELASNPKCENQAFFLHCLYFIVGDAAMQEWPESLRNAVYGLIERGASSESRQLRKWAAQARELISRPLSFVYDQWCSGGLSFENRP
jgi:hypothetical protein